MNVVFDSSLFATRIYEREQDIVGLHANEHKPTIKRLILDPLEELTGKDQTRNYGRWKQGATPKDIPTLLALCDALDCDVDYLLGRQDVPRRSAQTLEEATGLNADTAYLLTHLSLEEQTCLDIILNNADAVKDLLNGVASYFKMPLDRTLDELYGRGYYGSSLDIDDVEEMRLEKASRLFTNLLISCVSESPLLHKVIQSQIDRLTQQNQHAMSRAGEEYLAHKEFYDLLNSPEGIERLRDLFEKGACQHVQAEES